tara:strand:- start:151 stop:828 length:678 start_codon:yes stop_codon:yes gene_type:complete
MEPINRIIFTLPHAFCFDGDTRARKKCDMKSQHFTELIMEKCKEVGIKFTTIYSKQNRSVMDDNRFSTNGNNIWNDSPLWAELRKQVKEYHDKYKSFDHLLILDMHSFPRDDVESYILDIHPPQQIVSKLSKYLKDAGVNIVIRRAGIGNNSITNLHVLHPVPIRSILFEIGETLSDERLNEIATKFTDFLKTLYKEDDQLNHQTHQGALIPISLAIASAGVVML